MITLADVAAADFQGQVRSVLLLFRPPNGGPPGVPDGAILGARVPVYGTRDAGGRVRNKLIDASSSAGLIVSGISLILYTI